MHPAVAISRHGIKSSTFAPNAYVWVTDDQVSDAFDRFTSRFSTSARRSRKQPNHRCIRYSSNAAGSLEARKKLARRRFNNVSSNWNPCELGPPPPAHTALLSGLPHGLFTEPYMPPELKWQGPGLKPPDSSGSLPFPSWLLPPKPPGSNHEPSFPATSLANLLSNYSGTIRLSVTEYKKQLLGVKSLAQLQDLHLDLGNTKLEAALCSSVAFDHLFSKHKGNQSFDCTRSDSGFISLAELLTFTQDGRLEHTKGANLAKLANYMAKGNCSPLERLKLMELIEIGMKTDVSFSAQALAELYCCMPQLLCAASGDQISHRVDTLKLISASFLRRIEQHAEVLPPTRSDLNNLNYISSTLANSEDNGTMTLFILERIVRGLQTGNVSLYQVSEILNETGLLKQSTTKGLQSNPMLQYLTNIWNTREKPSDPPARVYLVGPILQIVNLLPVTRPTMSFTSELIREHASKGIFSTNNMNLLEMQSLMGNSVQRFLLYDKLMQQPSNSTPHELPNRPNDRPRQHLPLNDKKQLSSLTELLNTLPSSYAEQWIILTTEILIRDLLLKDRDEALQAINAWIYAIFSCRDHGWSDWKISRHPLWRSVLWQLSRVVKPAEVLANFQQTPGYYICEILIETWIRREVENETLAGGDPLWVERVDPKGLTQCLPLPSGSHNNRVKELQTKFVDITLDTLSYSLEYWYMRRLYKVGERNRWKPSSSAYLALLKTIQLYGLELDDPLSQLLELAFLRGRPGVVEGLVHFSRVKLNMTLSDAGHNVVAAHITRSAHTAPGRVLGIFKSYRAHSLSRNPGFLQVLIATRKSHVHPRSILRLLWRPDPTAQLPWGHSNRIRPNCPLTGFRIDFVHDAALAFANGSRFSTRSAWRCVLYCLRYLCHHNAPLDSRISKALITCCIIRSLRDPNERPVQKDWLNFCITVVERVEGKEIANAVRSMVQKYERSTVHNRSSLRIATP